MKDNKMNSQCVPSEAINRMVCDCADEVQATSKDECSSKPASNNCEQQECAEAEVEECKFEAHIKGTTCTRTRKRSQWK